MPSQFVIRNFVEEGVYHVYNRGVEKRNIFMSDIDYKIFMYYLYIYLSPLTKLLSNYPDLPFRLRAKNLASEVEIISYCLMPNHFHLLLKQHTTDGIPKLMKQITNAYTEYFNKKYRRDGCLMQGRYKSIQIETDSLLIHISRYIHLNPVVANICYAANNYKWSSMNEYLIKKENGFCHKELIMHQFTTPQKYEKFIKDHVDYARQLDAIKHLTID